MSFVYIIVGVKLASVT